MSSNKQVIISNKDLRKNLIYSILQTFFLFVIYMLVGFCAFDDKITIYENGSKSLPALFSIIYFVGGVFFIVSGCIIKNAWVLYKKGKLCDC